MKLNCVKQEAMSTPEPRPAATVVLMRDSPAGLQVLLTVRPQHLRFMGGASVFPGGGVAAADDDPRWSEASALDPDGAGRALGDDGGRALGWYICALREAFEEVGCIAGTGPLGVLTRSDAEDPERFLSACTTHGIVLATDQMVPGGRWVTPLGSPVRFDTRFFLKVVPDGWEPVPDPSEVESCDWVTPGEALAAMAAGTRLMAPPTIEMLQRLDRYTSCSEALEAFGARGLKGAGNVLSMRISPLVHVVLAPNAGVMTGPGTNTYVVGSGPYLVIDPATDDDEYLDALLEATEGRVDRILITHRHPDHVGGASRLSGTTGAEVMAYGSEPAGGAPVTPIGDGDIIEVAGVRLRALHTPGHASDHLCFYMEGAASLFAGDNILGEGTAVIAPPDGDMRAYMETLERLRHLHIDRIYPGHWKPLDGGTAVIDGYITHRRQRQAKVLEAVGSEPTSLDVVVERAYADTPPHLHPIARFSARAQLEMLAAEGKVEAADDLWRRVPEQ